VIVAALQLCPVFLDVGSNLDRFSSFLDTCEAGLAVLPELCTTGYAFNSVEQLRDFAEDIDGRSLRFFRDQAVKKKMIIVAGFPELHGGLIFNSSITALPDGTFHVYRKIHLFGKEKQLFAPGDNGFTVINWKGVRIGVMICYDWRFPESVRTLALKGAQIIAHPSDLVAMPHLWKPVMQTRAFENKVFTITADRNGSETQDGEELVFHGCSQITDTSGRILSELDEPSEGWIYADIDPAKADNKRFSPWNDIIADRRPGMYEL
jgi:predicted amidohydrolase